ncbi:MAG: YlxR family protein [Clostridiales bacterium]|jgi:predicted RNA-binding protein YlxR (DUF448 family)|nr:YlxR family protein [Clostridiales bacterium]
MKKRKIPLRKCTGCQEMKEKKQLIRVVKSENEGFSLDFTGKKSGRGAYVCPDVSCLEKARKQKGLERSFECAVPPEIYDMLRDELIKNGC